MYDQQVFARYNHDQMRKTLWQGPYESKWTFKWTVLNETDHSVFGDMNNEKTL